MGGNDSEEQNVAEFDAKISFKKIQFIKFHLYDVRHLFQLQRVDVRNLLYGSMVFIFGPISV